MKSMRSRSCRRGLILIFVLLVLVVLGTAMVHVQQGTGSLLRESSRLYCEACVENLVASGQAWARRNLEAERPAATAPATAPAAASAERELDVREFGAARASLRIVSAQASSRPAKAAPTVEARCDQGRYQARRERAVWR